MEGDNGLSAMGMMNWMSKEQCPLDIWEVIAAEGSRRERLCKSARENKDNTNKAPAVETAIQR